MDDLGAVTVSNEDFDFEDAIGHQARDTALAEFLGSSITRGRLMFGMLVLFLVFGGFVFRLGYLQIYKGNFYFDLAEGNRIRVHRLNADRGIVKDRNGEILSSNVPSFSLWVDDLILDDENEYLKSVSVIAELLDEDESAVHERLVSEKDVAGEILITRDLPFEKAMMVLASSEDYSILRVEAGTLREFNVDSSLTLSSILGYVGIISSDEYEERKEAGYFRRDLVGKAGLEKSFEVLLRGFPGERRVEVDSMGREQSILQERLAVDGADLTLNIDSDLQAFIEHRLDDVRDKWNISNASVIVLDPSDGAVLALVSYPGYDGNLFSGGISVSDYAGLVEDESRPLFTRVISGQFPSGSTFKPIVSAAALDEGIIDEDTSFLSTGGLRIGQFFFPDWKAGGHGVTNVTKALADSVNTFFYIVGGGYGEFDGIGLTKMMDAASRFGLGKQLGIDLPGEASGFLPTAEWKMRVKDEPWYIGDTYHAAIGQGDILVTPLQVAAFTSVFANGHVLYTPQVVDGYDMQGTYHDISPQVVYDLPASEESIEIVRKGLRRAVTDGSAWRLKDLPVTSAGKTGTAQWNTNKPNHAWFTGFAPYEDAEIVVTVLVEEGGEGSTVAVPLAKDIFEWWFSK